MVRKMQNFEVKQRTCDGYFNASCLLTQWSNANDRKDIDQFFRLEQTKQFLEVLENEENLQPYNSRKSNESTTYKVVRGNKSKGETSQYWMHPILFIKFAMWINPRFEYFVIKFVYDELIKFRHSAGDNYRGLTSALVNFENVDYVKLATGLNYIVFGEHHNGIRQNATQEQLKELTALQQQLAFTIKMGYVRTFEQLINEMRRIYDMKYNQYLR